VPAIRAVVKRGQVCAQLDAGIRDSGFGIRAE